MKKYSRPLKGSEFFTSWVSSFIWKYTILLCVLLQEEALNQCENTLEGETLKQVDLLQRHVAFFSTFKALQKKTRILRVNYTFHGLLRTFFSGRSSSFRFITTDGQIEDTGESLLQKSYLVSSRQRSRSPVCSNYPSEE